MIELHIGQGKLFEIAGSEDADPGIKYLEGLGAGPGLGLEIGSWCKR